MTTYYKQIPTLEMRVAAVPLIVTGTVGKVVSTLVDSYDHEPFVRTTYEVIVQKVLKGDLKQRTIQVEVPGGKSGTVVTPLGVPMREGGSFVMMLVPEAGEASFVPYFGSAFPLQQDGQVLLGPQAAKILGSHGAGSKSKSISLSALRALIAAVAKREAAEAKAAVAAGSGQPLPPVLEMPQAFGGGGEPAAPQAGEQPKSPN